MLQKKVIVLGAGLIGKEIAIAFSSIYDTACADFQMCALEALSPKYPVTVIPCNLKDQNALRELIKSYDLVVNAVPSPLGFETLKIILEERKDVINVTLVSEDVSVLEREAVMNNIMVVMIASDQPRPVHTAMSAVKYFFSGMRPRAGLVHLHDKTIMV